MNTSFPKTFDNIYLVTNAQNTSQHFHVRASAPLPMSAGAHDYFSYSKFQLNLLYESPEIGVFVVMSRPINEYFKNNIK